MPSYIRPVSDKSGTWDGCHYGYSTTLDFEADLQDAEGDLEKNAKLWYQEVDPSILGVYWNRIDSANPQQAAVHNMYRIMRVKAGKGGAKKEFRKEEEEEEEVRQVKWDELVCVMEELEKLHGWAEVDGTRFYTREDPEPGHKSMVLGE